jgi:Ca2+-binding RTX toxin-like protein
MASVVFSPQGTQLDNDEIADIQVKVSDPLEFGFTLDTSGLDANLQSIKLGLEGDSTEVNLSDTLTDFFETTFPDVAVVEDNSNGDFTSVVVELKGEPGAVPNTTNVLVESEATILDGLANDGATDIGVTVVEAIDVNGTDVTEKFVPSQQTIDLQPLPPVQSIFGTPESDPIIGTSQDDLIEGKEGNDLIIDNEGNDNSFGEEGSDLFIDDVGNDTIVGGADNDFVNIDSDSGGDDTINLGLGNDLAFGGTGTDTFVLNRDSGVTGIGDFTAGEDRFALGENLTKEDLSFAQLDNDNLGSLNGSTVITDANTGKVIAFVNAGVGEDRVFGGNGTNIFNGEAGNDLLNGGVDENVLNGGDGDDTLLGGIGSGIFNVLNGDNGNDVMVGGSDGNAIGGGQGDDLLFGGAGNSGLVGNEGHDTFAFASGEGADIVFDFEPGQDAIALTSGSSYDSLQIEYNTEGNYTNISEETGELITTLIGVEADQLAESNFTTI